MVDKINMNGDSEMFGLFTVEFYRMCTYYVNASFRKKGNREKEYPQIS